MEFEDQLKTLKEQLKFDKKFDFSGLKFDNLVMAGMGGSGIVGGIVKDLYSSIPVSVINDYSIPKFVNESTLFIAVSYSGNTEETISATNEAIAKGAKVYAITSGGSLKDLVKDSIIIPSGLQPRAALGYMTIPILRSLGVINDEDVDKAYELLDELDNNNEEAKAIATEIDEKSSIPVIYGVPPYLAVSYRWKTQFNENAKILGYSSNFSELDHNDMMALKNTYRRNEFYFMCLNDSLDQRIQKRIKTTQELSGINMRMISAKGDTEFEREFYLIHFGDWVTYHLAMLRQQNPDDVSLIEELKKDLK